MFSVVHKTLEVETIRPAFALKITDADGESVVVEYLAPSAPQRLQHREAFDRALRILTVKAWNPAECTYEVMTLAVSNCERKFSWWEVIETYTFAESLSIISGQMVVELLKPTEPEPENAAQVENAMANGPAPEPGPDQPSAEVAGRKCEHETMRDLLKAVFGTAPKAA